MKSCEGCSGSIKYHLDWENPPNFCKACKDRFSKRAVSCKQCGTPFELSVALQARCSKNGWGLPKICHQCKHDSLLMKGAVGALRDQFPFALETTIEQRGLIFTDKVAVVRSKKTREVVAEVKMDVEGFIFVDRVAVATSVKTGERLSKTYDGVDGFFFQERAAETYDFRSREMSHVTKNVERGLIFPRTVAETRATGAGGRERTTTERRRRGFIFEEDYLETDND